MTHLYRIVAGACWCLAISLLGLALVTWPGASVYADEPPDGSDTCVESDAPQHAAASLPSAVAAIVTGCGGDIKCDPASACRGGVQSTVGGCTDRCTDAAAPLTCNLNLCLENDPNTGRTKPCCVPCKCKYKSFIIYYTCHCKA